jgi:predicted Zn finger-like uncharacterized protein
MYSQCPDCQTRFRVTAEVLRVAQGTVRCGRCGNAFNALARLSDTVPPRGNAASTAALVGADHDRRRAAESGPAVEFHFTADDLERVFVDERDWRRQFGPRSTGPEVALATSEPSELLVDESESLEDITLEGERIRIEVPPWLEDEEVPEVEARDAPVDLDATDRFRALKVADDHAVAEAPGDDDPTGEHEVAEVLRLAEALRAEEDAVAAAAAAESEIQKAAAPLAQPAPRAPEPIVQPVGSIAPRRWQPPARPVDEEDLPIGRRATDEYEEEVPRRGGLAWTFGSLALALVLVAQLTHYYRQDLVRQPQIGPALSLVYDRLGLDLAPNWDPRAFEIRQWGEAGAAGVAGRMSVQASIRNKAPFAQPFPLLRLELEDRFGSAVATRDFEPAEYLKVPALATRMLAAGASADADLEIADPGADAVGYRLDVCLRESAEILRCAQGPG